MAENQLVKYMTDTGEVTLSPEIIKAYLVSGDPDKVTSQEVTMFLQLCRYQKLNPFLREAYLIKFGTSPATLVTGKEVFTKRAASIESCGGWAAGITIQTKSGEIIQRKGTMLLAGEVLIGGWAKVFRKDWVEPLEDEVSLTEYQRNKADGTPMSSWKSMPATMIRKVALVHALREAFPDKFQGLYTPEEMPIDDSRLTAEPINITPDKQPIQPTTSKSQTAAKGLSEAQVKRFYAIIKGSGATEEIVKVILNNEVPGNFNQEGKFDWNNVSKVQYNTLCDMFEKGNWQAKYTEIMELEDITNNLLGAANA
jgi:phage recombination protein Bet